MKNHPSTLRVIYYLPSLTEASFVSAAKQRTLLAPGGLMIFIVARGGIPA
jgi:hypothetical protein